MKNIYKKLVKVLNSPKIGDKESLYSYLRVKSMNKTLDCKKLKQ